MRLADRERGELPHLATGICQLIACPVRRPIRAVPPGTFAEIVACEMSPLEMGRSLGRDLKNSVQSYD